MLMERHTVAMEMCGSRSSSGFSQADHPTLLQRRSSTNFDRMEPGRTLLLFCGLLLSNVLPATEYVVPPGDVAGFFATLPKDATYVSFSAAAEYTCAEDIVLPGKQLLVIDGKGCTLKLGPKSNGFTMVVTDQKEAMRRTANRYTIRDFAMIQGGRKAIDLQATLNSTIVNCRMTGQSDVGIDLRFCLMARVQNVLVTNPTRKGIQVRCGDWPGANARNSQSNHTVLDQCRVYASATTTEAFTVLGSGGVHLVDCISEGAMADYDLFLSAGSATDLDAPATNPVVKSFSLSNFHVEHRLRKASIYVNMPVKCTVDLSNIYWNSPITVPVIEYVSGQLNVSNIGWWNPAFRIRTRSTRPHLNFDACHKALVIPDKPDGTGTKAGALELVVPAPTQGKLDLSFVRITRRAM